MASNRVPLDPDDEDWEGRLRMKVPRSFVVAASVLVVVSAAIVVHLASSGIRLTSGEPGVVLVSRRAAMRSGLRAQLLAGGRGGRMQQLADADADAEEEEEDPVIRFENDDKVMGGDLQVPVSMVDYENLGEGSIVDQRYPRKLPGADELSAEWNSFLAELSFGGGEELPAAPQQEATVRPGFPTDDSVEGVRKLERLGVNVHGARKPHPAPAAEPAAEPADDAPADSEAPAA